MAFRKLYISTLIIFYIVSSCDTLTYLRKGGDHLYLNDGKSELFWFCGIHSNDPDNIMFKDIKTEFIHFKPDLVLVEGGRDKNIKTNESDAIIHGESSYVAYLASQNNIECLSIEPPDSYIGRELLLKYEINDIITMIILRQIKQWQRESESRPIEFEEMIVGWVNTNSIDMFPDSNIEISLIFIQDLLEPYTGFRVDDTNWLDVPADKNWRVSYADKDDDDYLLHLIYDDILTIRNKYLVELIRNKKKQYNRIFIMMGFDHADETMLQLEDIYKNTST